MKYVLVIIHNATLITITNIQFILYNYNIN